MIILCILVSLHWGWHTNCHHDMASYCTTLHAAPVSPDLNMTDPSRTPGEQESRIRTVRAMLVGVDPDEPSRVECAMNLNMKDTSRMQGEQESRVWMTVRAMLMMGMDRDELSRVECTMNGMNLNTKDTSRMLGEQECRVQTTARAMVVGWVWIQISLMWDAGYESQVGWPDLQYGVDTRRDTIRMLVTTERIGHR